MEIEFNLLVLFVFLFRKIDSKQIKGVSQKNVVL